MKLKYIIISLLLSFLISTGCESDYDIDKYFGADFVPRVVLNSIITPDQQIFASLYWSKYYADTTDYKMVESFDVELYENDSLIDSGQYADGLIAISYSPKESKTYRFKINVPNYGEISATTTIPTPITATAEYVEMLEMDSENSVNPYRFAHFKITEMSSKEDFRAVWIMTQYAYLLDGPNPSINGDRSYFLYSDSQFADKLNARRDLWCSQAKGSSVSYNQYIRISYSNFTKALPLDFSIETTGRFEDRRSKAPQKTDSSDTNNIPTTPLFTTLNVVTPSTDYDQYRESVSESYQIDPFGSGGSYVYSNIQNGLGIFAGYSVSLYVFDYNNGGN